MLEKMNQMDHMHKNNILWIQCCLCRLSKHDLNQILAEEVMNRFKELDLVDRMPEELWTEVCNTV